ncbi:MAG: heavy-metal-associated domain-containing protein [Rhodobacteraceae bacterium]|jgi:copper chaperone|nr:heavy-metal-associated domain-containing protein [Paracoccaceae bacterium]
MEFRIEAMECGGCARAVTRAIRSVDPAAEVAADVGNRSVSVASQIPREAFLAALASAGFPVAAPPGELSALPGV